MSTARPGYESRDRCYVLSPRVQSTQVTWPGEEGTKRGLSCSETPPSFAEGANFANSSEAARRVEAETGEPAAQGVGRVTPGDAGSRGGRARPGAGGGRVTEGPRVVRAPAALTHLLQSSCDLRDRIVGAVRKRGQLSAPRCAERAGSARLCLPRTPPASSTQLRPRPHAWTQGGRPPRCWGGRRTPPRRENLQ